MRTGFSAFLALLVTICIVTVMALLIEPAPRPVAERESPALYVRPLPGGYRCENPSMGLYREANARLRERIRDAAACRQDKDCDVLEVDCAYGGPQAVNRSTRNELLEAIDTFESESCWVMSISHCGWFRSGRIIEGAQCVQGTCELRVSQVDHRLRYEELYVPPVAEPLPGDGRP